MAVAKGRDARFMRIAIKKTVEGIKDGQTPFGAAIVKDGKLICAAHNVVWDTMDITAHGEVNAIRIACRRLGTIDLSGCTIYSTCEPCPMCFSAIHWAKISRIVFGATIADAKSAGFRELEITNAQMKRMGKSKIKIKGGVLRSECLRLFALFRKHEGRKKLY
ncbi:MAG: nucleoside deaminase [Candidatus Micrarchaeota archaeon]|nr:nucleoside deaminase [Candidatus Micrarchaeota archaeon]